MNIDLDKIIEYYHKDITERGGCGGPIMAYMIAMLCLFLLCGCRSVQYVPVVEQHTDSVYLTKIQYDSIFQHDSIYLHEYARNDTVYMELTKWHTRYIEKLRVDTMYEHRTDSVPVPYEVPAKLSKWQRLCVDWGGYAIVATILLFFILTVRFIRKFLP